MQTFHVPKIVIELCSCHYRPRWRKFMWIWILWLSHLCIISTGFNTFIHHISFFSKRLSCLFDSLWIVLLSRILFFEFKWFLKQHQIILNAIFLLLASWNFFMILFLSFFEPGQVNGLVVLNSLHLTVNFYYKKAHSNLYEISLIDWSFFHSKPQYIPEVLVIFQWLIFESVLKPIFFLHLNDFIIYFCRYHWCFDLKKDQFLSLI